MSDHVRRPPILSEAKFSLGQLIITNEILSRIGFEEICFAVSRHRVGDWGELDEEDWQGNERALSSNRRLLSVYIALNGQPFWVITSGNRNETKVVFADYN